MKLIESIAVRRTWSADGNVSMRCRCVRWGDRSWGLWAQHCNGHGRWTRPISPALARGLTAAGGRGASAGRRRVPLPGVDGAFAQVAIYDDDDDEETVTLTSKAIRSLLTDGMTPTAAATAHYSILLWFSPHLNLFFFGDDKNNHYYYYYDMFDI